MALYASAGIEFWAKVLDKVNQYNTLYNAIEYLKACASATVEQIRRFEELVIAGIPQRLRLFWHETSSSYPSFRPDSYFDNVTQIPPFPPYGSEYYVGDTSGYDQPWRLPLPPGNHTAAYITISPPEPYHTDLYTTPNGVQGHTIGQLSSLNISPTSCVHIILYAFFMAILAYCRFVWAPSRELQWQQATKDQVVDDLDLAISTGALNQEDWDQRVDAVKREAVEEATKITNEQISDLEDRLQAQQLKLQDFDLEKKTLRTDLRTSQRDLSTSQSNARQLQHDLQRERNSSQTLATSRDALETRVTDFEAREKNQRKEIQLLQAKRKTEQGDSEEKATGLEKQLHLARSSLQSEKDRCENRKAEFNAAEAELRKTLEKSKVENQRLMNDNTALRRSMSSMTALTAEKGKLIREKEQAIEEKNQAARDKHGAITEKDAAVQENVALQAHVNDLEAKTAQLHEKITSLCSLHQTSLREKVAKIIALEKTYGSLQSEATRARTCESSLKSQKDELMQRTTALERSLALKQQECDAASRTAEDLRQTNHALNTDLARLDTTRRDQEADIMHLKHEASERDQMYDNDKNYYAGAIGDLEEEKANLLEKISTLQREGQILQAEQTGLEETKRALEEELSEQTNSHYSIKSMNKQLRERNDDLSKQLQAYADAGRAPHATGQEVNQPDPIRTSIMAYANNALESQEREDPQPSPDNDAVEQQESFERVLMYNTFTFKPHVSMPPNLRKARIPKTVLNQRHNEWVQRGLQKEREEAPKVEELRKTAYRFLAAGLSQEFSGVNTFIGGPEVSEAPSQRLPSAGDEGATQPLTPLAEQYGLKTPESVAETVTQPSEQASPSKAQEIKEKKPKKGLEASRWGD